MPSIPNVQSATNKVVIVACPVSRCEVKHIAGVGVLMALGYVDKAEQFETGERTILQALIDPEHALEIGEALRRSVQAFELGKALKKALKKPPVKKSAKRSAKKPPMLLPAPAPDEPATIPSAILEPVTIEPVMIEPAMIEPAMADAVPA